MFLKWLKNRRQPVPVPPRHILENISPGLAGMIQSASLERRRGLLVKAFALAGRSIKQIEPELQRLMEDYRRDGTLSESQITAARQFAEAADEKYSEAEAREADSKIAEHWFQNARLATALADANAGADWTNAADAIYELSVISNDASELFQLVRVELKD
mgnify:FL=1